MLESLQSRDVFQGQSESLSGVSAWNGVSRWNQHGSVHGGLVLDRSSDVMLNLPGRLCLSKKGVCTGTVCSRVIL